MDQNKQISRKRMLKTNEKQKAHYEATNPHIETGGTATHLWASMRRWLQSWRSSAGITNFAESTLREWVGNVEGKKVLDFGCFSGNPHSLEIAKNCREYIGLDLSESAIQRLQEKLKDIPHARAIASDILSDKFKEKDFDIIYARSVLHHFEDIEAMLDTLTSKMSPNGALVCLDPLQTSIPVRIARTLYRPFQSDRAWEWPFDRKTFRTIEKHFTIEKVQGILGASKWTALAAPFGKKASLRLAQRLHERDVNRANQVGKGLWPCMLVVMRLRLNK